MEKENKPLIEEVMNSTVFLGKLTQGTFDLDDVKQAVKKAYLEIENIAYCSPRIRIRLKQIFKDKFGFDL